MIMYKINKSFNIENGIIRLTDNAFIPVNLDNIDYQAYLAWISEGNIPLPAEGTE